MNPPEHPITAILPALRRISEKYDTILPPVKVVEECRRIAGEGRVHRRVIGSSEGGKSIEAYEIGSGTPVLLYGFPDPGEAVGGTAIAALLRALVEKDPFLQSFGVRWHFIPCLNPDDQPDDGQSIRTVVRDKQKREVDWCVDNPRKETTALVDYVREIEPQFTFPLHDEYHCGDSLAMYFPVCGCLAPSAASRIRELLDTYGVPISSDMSDPTLGQGFFPCEGELDYKDSTFAVMAEYGTVFIAEISCRPELTPSQTVAVQFGAGLIVLASILSHSGRGDAPKILFAR